MDNTALHQRLKKNILLHLIILMEVNKTPYGTMTINVPLVNGVAQLTQLNIIKSRRKKYKIT